MDEPQAADRARNLIQDFINLRRLIPFFHGHLWTVIVASMMVPTIAILQILQPLVLKRAIDDGILAGDDGILAKTALAFLVIIATEYGCRLTQSILSAVAVQKMIAKLRAFLVHHILHLSARFHDDHLSGALVTRATSDFDNLAESLSQGVFSSIVDLCVLVACVVAMFMLDARLAAVTLLLLPGIVVLVNWFSRAIKSALLKARKYLAQSNAFAQECLYGISTVKSLVAETHCERHFIELNGKYRDEQIKSVSFDAVLYSLLDGLASVVVGIILWIAVSGLLDNVLTAGLVVAFVRLVQQLFDPLKQLGSTMAMLQGAFTAVERIFSIVDNRDFIGGTEDPKVTAGRVEFDDVVFRYRPDLKPTLRGVSFTLEPGQSMAVVGKTGSGKTSIIRLLSKLYEDYSGTITIDSQDLRALNPWSLRQQIALVPQDIILFTGTLRFNIGLGRADIDDDAIHDAIEAIGARRLLNALPGGLDFLISEQGANLSQGQKQLVVFCRAMVGNPGLVILDEATSEIDPATEQLLQESLLKLLRNRSCIIIAHRLETIRHCDHILVLNEGTIVEQGNHQDLLALHGVYHRMYGAHEPIAS